MFPPHFTASFFGPNFFQVQIFGIVLHVLVAPLEIKPLGPGTWVLPRCKCLIWIFVLGTPGHCQRRDGRCGDFAEGQNMVGKLVSPKIHTWLLLKEYVCYTIWSLSLSHYIFSSCVYIHKSMYTCFGLCSPEFVGDPGLLQIYHFIREEFLSRPE